MACKYPASDGGGQLLGQSRGNSGGVRGLLRCLFVVVALAVACPTAAHASSGYWPEGVPYKGASTSDIRWVENGYVWYVPSMAVLNQCLGGSSRIRTISDSDFSQLKASYPDGGNISCPNYPVGTLYKAPYNSDVWVISNSQSWYVPNEATVDCWGGWGKVHWVSAGEAVRLRYTYPPQSHNSSASCPLANGYQFKGSDSTVWTVWNNLRYAEPSMQMYNQCVWQGFFQPYQTVADSTRDNWLSFFGSGGNSWCSHAPRADNAMSWAVGQLGSSKMPDGWSTANGCDHFVAMAYGATNSGYSSAYMHWRALLGQGQGHSGDSAVPYGALAFFGPVSGNPYGHVMLSLGNGRFVSTGATVHYASLSDFGNYQGWAWADSSYPGR